MNVEAQKSGIWNELQGKVISLANTFYGLEAIKNMTTFEDKIDKSSDFRNFGSLSITNSSKMEPSLKINTLSLDNLVDEKMFVDFSFNQVDKLVGTELPDVNKFIEFTNTLPVRKPVTVEDKINQLLEEKKAAKNETISKKELFINELHNNLGNITKTPIQKLESFCVLAEKYNSSRSFLHVIRVNNVKENEIINIVTKTANDNDKELRSKIPKRRRLKVN